MLQEATIESYLDEIQHLHEEGEEVEQTTLAILELIEEHLEETHENPNAHALFLGERAFYQHQYKIALKYYMEARDVPFFHFFCYRACAFLFEYDQKTEKALDFAQKALAIQPNDWTIHQLVRRLTELPVNTNNNDTDTEEMLIPATSPVTLATEEFNELTQLFWDAEQTLKSPLRSVPLEPAYDTHVRLGDSTLERRIQAFIDQRKRALHDYVSQSKLKGSHQDYLFHVLDGWHTQPLANDTALPLLLQQAARRTTGGYFLKWHGKGIAINPGPHFIDSLHRQGFFVTDIDAVVVTKGSPSYYADVTAIYRLNTQINSANEPLHVIHYYLCQPAYQALIRTLKPQFKQERQTVHCLELYRDSPEVESIALSDEIQLSYFTTKPVDASTDQPNQEQEDPVPPLGIRLDLKGPAHGSNPNVHVVRVGYLGGGVWHPSVAQHVTHCDLLITGIEKIHDDATHARSATQALGLTGTLSLLELAAPRLLLCCEFSGTEGDFRLELVQKLRQDYHPRNSRSTTILPGDTGLAVDLTTLQIRCAASQTFVDPAQIHAIRTSDQWDTLKYLSPQNIL